MIKTQQLNSLNKEKIFSIFILFVFFLLSLFDLYFLKYGRIFDIIGISFFLFYILFFNKFPKKISNNEFIILLSLLFLFLLLPPIFKNYLTHGFVLVGFCCFVIVRRLNTNIIRLNLFRLIIILIALQCIDYVAYKFFDSSIFYFDNKIILDVLRGYETNYFRPSGFFREANSFATVLTLLYMSLCRDSLPSLKLSALVIFSLILSNTMFGMGAAVIILILNLYKLKTFFLLKIFFVLFFILIIFTFSTDILFYRFYNFVNEGSIHARLNLFNYDKFNLVKLLIPSGFISLNLQGIYDKDQLFGVNGFSFIFDGIGLFAFFFYFIILNRLKFIPGFLFLSLNLTYYIYLNFLFYFVMAIYFPKSLEKN
jgi:hypothetical protein